MTKLPLTYDDHTWELIDADIKAKIAEYFQKTIFDDKTKSTKALIEACNQAYRKYKKEFPWAYFYFICFLLPFCFILIAPAFWCWKTFKELNNKRKALRTAFNQANNERIDNIILLINMINFNEVIDYLLGIVNYQRKGPVPGNVWNILKKHTGSELLCVGNSEFENPICTSWGVFKNHMLILNIANTKHWMEPKLYSKTIIASYIVYVDGKPTTRTEAITATMTAPYPYYKNSYSTDVVTTRCLPLTFYTIFDRKENAIQKHFPKSKYVPLENRAFNKEFPVARNAEDLIRMYFTADVQEYFVNTLQQYKDGKHFPTYFWWEKQGALVSSKYSLKTPFYLFDDLNFSFIQDINITIEAIFKTCGEWISNVVKEHFLSLNVAANLPILQTEYNDVMIDELNKASVANTKVYNDEYFQAHWVLHNIWSTPLLKADTQLMPVIHVLDKIKVGDLIVSHTKVTNHYYNAVQKVKIIHKHGFHTGLHAIPVEYTDFINQKHETTMYYCQVKPNIFLKPKGNNVAPEVLQIIKDYELNDKIRIKRGYLVFMDQTDNQFATFKTCLQNLLPFITNKKTLNSK